MVNTMCSIAERTRVSLQVSGKGISIPPINDCHLAFELTVLVMNAAGPSNFEPFNSPD